MIVVACPWCGADWRYIDPGVFDESELQEEVCPGCRGEHYEDEAAQP